MLGADIVANIPFDVLGSTITVAGSIFHNDGRRRIDLKKPIRDLFEPIETLTKVKYTMELSLNKAKVLKRTQELLEQGITPILFYFEKEERK